MLGQAISMVLPPVVGYRLTGKLGPSTTATDLVITITANLRRKGVVGKFVEFFGPGLSELSLADRATIANMCPEYGATMAFFPIDHRVLEYMTATGRSTTITEAYLRAQHLYVDTQQNLTSPSYSDVISLDLSSIVPCVSGPKRPHDRVELTCMKDDFNTCLTAPVGFKGFGLTECEAKASSTFSHKEERYTLHHGSVVIAAITSCTNTSNPNVMLGAGLLARNAVVKGLSTLPYIKTSLAPGSGVVTRYLKEAGLQQYLDHLGFNVVGFGCTTCIGNSGPLLPEVREAIEAIDLVVAAVLSGNRNFEGRVHALTRANYLASPPLVVAYALAGTVDIDFEHTPLGTDKEGKPVFLRDIWPSNHDIQDVVNRCVLPSMFKQVYSSIENGTDAWNALEVKESVLYPWSDESTYIHHPPFFQTMGRTPTPPPDIQGAYCLLNLGDSITTDHISPAGHIARRSPAATWLQDHGVDPPHFNTYGARRGNDLVMARGTFANLRLMNKMCDRVGPITTHVPSGEVIPVWLAAERYMNAAQSTIILAGTQYGSGSSRDWAAKGVLLQGVKAVIAKSFERIHRSNLVGMGVLPLQFSEGEGADSLGLSGKEQYTIEIPQPLIIGGKLTVSTNTGINFVVLVRLDTEMELRYYLHGGILQYVIRSLI